MSTPTRLCAWCEGPLPAGATHRRQYCKESCRRLALRRRRGQEPSPMNCQACGEEMLGGKAKKFCNSTCRNKARRDSRPKPMVASTCEHCSTTFESPRGRRYCTDACMFTAYNRGARKPAPTKADAFLAAPVKTILPQCCKGTPPDLYRDNDDTNVDPWNAPQVGTVDGLTEPLSNSVRYYIHERTFFHALGIHDDAHVAERLNITGDHLRRVLRWAGMTAHFPRG